MLFVFMQAEGPGPQIQQEDTFGAGTGYARQQRQADGQTADHRHQAFDMRIRVISPASSLQCVKYADDQNSIQQMTGQKADQEQA